MVPDQEPPLYTAAALYKCCQQDNPVVSVHQQD